MSKLSLERVNRTVIRYVFAVLLSGSVIAPAWSQGTSNLVPARFSDTETAISRKLEMPPGVVTGDNVVGIPCQAIVEPTGKVTDVNCFTDLETNRPYVREIFDAAAEGTISPALVNRLPVRVMMNFTVLFICQESECNVGAVPHHNVHSKKYGLNYFAPQPILHDDNWYPGFDEKMSIIRGRGGQIPVATRFGGMGAGMAGMGAQGGGGRGKGGGANAAQLPPPGLPAYIIRVDIDAAGTPQKSGVEKRQDGMLDEAKLAADGLGNVSYIPGYVDGAPVEMEYQELGVVNYVAPATGLGPLNAPR